MMALSPRTVLPAALAAVLHVAPPSPAQVPDTFENLRVLPEDVAKTDLVETMRQFCFALGVRCTHCHVAKEDDPGAVGNFASDDLPAKRKARAMMEMVNEINGRHLADLPARTDPAVTVSCATCHGGIAVPLALEERLERVREKDGLEAALQEYAALQERYRGSRAYDFGMRSLLNLAEARMAAGAAEDAVAFLELNRDEHPDALESVIALANAYREAGRPDDAAAAYRDIIDRAPESWWAKAARKALGELDEPTER